MPGHLGERGTGGADQLTRCGVLLVVPTQVARVVVGHVLADGGHRHQLLVADQPVQQLSVVQHGVIRAELLVLASQRVEAVRAGDDDLAVVRLDAVEQVVDGLLVLRGELLEQELVARAAGRVTGAGLAGAQHEELHARRGEQFGDGLGGLLGAVLEGARAADPEEVLEAREALDVLSVDRHVEVDLVDPRFAFLGALAPGVALLLEVLEQHTELTGELGGDHHLVAAHVDDVVDVLDVHRALLDARAARGAGPQHVGVDDAEFLGGAHQRAGGLLGAGSHDALEAGLGDVLVRVLLAALLAADLLADAALGRVLERGLRVTQDVRRLREQVVAQVHDDELGGQRLSGVPRRALRLAAAALGARREVEVALPGEVLDLAAAEHRVLVGVLEVDVLAVVLHRQQRTQRVGQSFEGDVHRGQADVEVLGVQHDQQEHQGDADVQQQRDALDDQVGRLTQRAQCGADSVGEEGAPAVGQVVGRHRGAAEQRVRPDDVEDHEEDQPRAAGVRAVEAGLAADLLGFADDADDRERDDARQHGEREEVLQEAECVPASDERDGELGVEQHAEGLEVHGAEDEEAPHGEEVGHAGDVPPQESCLREDLFDLRHDAGLHIVLAGILVDGLLTGRDELHQEQHPLRGEGQHDDQTDDADDHRDQHQGVFVHRVPPEFHELPMSNLGLLLEGNLSKCQLIVAPSKTRSLRRHT